MKKIIIVLLIIFISISQTNAWLWLIAESWDLLNISKWNELVNKKLEQIDVTWTWNIDVHNSWKWVEISLTWAIESSPIPYIITKKIVGIKVETTRTLVIDGDNFTPNSVVSIPWFDWSIDSTTINWMYKITIDVTAGTNTGLYDIVVSNNWVLNTAFIWNWSNLIEVVEDYLIEWDDTIWRKYNNGTFATSCNTYKNPSWDYVYDWDIWNWIYWIKPNSDPEFKVYCDMTTSWGWWTRIYYHTAVWDYKFITDLKDPEYNLDSWGFSEAMNILAFDDILLKEEWNDYTWSHSANYFMNIYDTHPEWASNYWHWDDYESHLVINWDPKAQILLSDNEWASSKDLCWFYFGTTYWEYWSDNSDWSWKWNPECLFWEPTSTSNAPTDAYLFIR